MVSGSSFRQTVEASGRFKKSIFLVIGDGAVRRISLLMGSLPTLLLCLVPHAFATADGKVSVSVDEMRKVLTVKSRELEGLVVQRYEESQSGNPYATDLDRRVVVVARGERLEALMRAAGIASASGKQSLGKTLLVQPPLEDQVHRRSPSGAARKHKRWQLWSEAVEYGAQGSAQGFTIDCVTAIRNERPYATAVAECFPLEERKRFLLMLERIR